MSVPERRLQILRRTILIHIDLKDYDQVYATAREVIEYYLANNQREVAVGFYKTLPPLGERDHRRPLARYRVECLQRGRIRKRQRPGEIAPLFQERQGFRGGDQDGGGHVAAGY